MPFRTAAFKNEQRCALNDTRHNIDQLLHLLEWIQPYLLYNKIIIKYYIDKYWIDINNLNLPTLKPLA